MLKNTTRTWYLVITKKADNAAKNAKPLINLDVNNPDFKAGVMLWLTFFRFSVMMITW